MAERATPCVARRRSRTSPTIPASARIRSAGRLTSSSRSMRLHHRHAAAQGDGPAADARAGSKRDGAIFARRAYRTTSATSSALLGQHRALGRAGNLPLHGPRAWPWATCRGSRPPDPGEAKRRRCTARRAGLPMRARRQGLLQRAGGDELGSVEAGEGNGRGRPRFSGGGVLQAGGHRADVQLPELPRVDHPGAPVIWSVPCFVLGKGMTSRMLARP